MEYDRVVRTTAWSPGPGCHGGCGLKMYVKDGRLVKVEGDEEHPYSQGRTCARALALTQFVYHPERFTHPMKRVGERGEGRFERITWDEALDTVERRFNDIKEKYGPESVIFIQGRGAISAAPSPSCATRSAAPTGCSWGWPGTPATPLVWGP
jgi:anaerobic selenocysteine-containing dehydrogenase